MRHSDIVIVLRASSLKSCASTCVLCGDKTVPRRLWSGGTE
nr:MAG TPA: hypothetical protein [Caudoviricetes sp.]